MVEAWSLTAEEREETIARISAMICTLAFFKDTHISHDAARAAAAAAEKKAYTTAQVATRTTTCVRPAAESASTYARKLSELVLEAVADAQVPASSNGAAGIAAVDELDISGKRDFLDHESASSILAPLASPGAAIRKVRFSTKSFGREAAAVAAKALSNIAHCLHHADVSDVVAGRPEDEALDALRVLASALKAAPLKHLNVSDNALGEKGVRALADAFTHQTGLEFLSLQNVGCSVHACAAVSELINPAGSLTGLHLFNNMSGDEGAAHIAKVLAVNRGMQDFKMASSRVGPAGGKALAQALALGASLVRLDLSDNPMTAEVGPHLSKCLAAQPALTSLNLNDTSLTDEGVAALAQGLAAGAPQLTCLELALNEITAEGMRALGPALISMTSLSRLNLRENELEDGGAAVLARVLPALGGLRELDVSANQLTRPGAVRLVQAITSPRTAGGAAAAAAGFDFLGLDENGISESGVDTIKELLQAAFGSDKALGPLDDNDPDMDEADEADLEGLVDEGADDLAAALAKVNL